MPTTSFERQAGPLEKRLLTGLLRLGVAVKTDSNRQAGSAGLSPLQGQVLSCLLRAPAEMRLRQVADEIGVRPATASEAVTTLENKRLLHKKPCAKDGRAIGLTLTAAGKRAASEWSAWPDFLLASLATLHAAEQEVLLRVLVSIIRDLHRDGRIRVARVCPACRFFRPSAHPGGSRPHHCDFADSAFGDRHLRMDCSDWQALEATQGPRRGKAEVTAPARRKLPA